MGVVSREREQAALHGLLDAIRTANGSLDPHWESALRIIHRRQFLPRLVWPQNEDGEYIQLDADAEPEKWFNLAYANQPVVTQVNDGRPVGSNDPVLPSSSASDPAIVVRMLTMLDPRPGQKILEIGTGTGWNTALLAHTIGAENVTSIEIDPSVAQHAAAALSSVLLKPRIITGDGELGWPASAPYHHTVATCAVHHIPPAWVEQTRPGGTILTPWNSPWCDYGLLHLTVQSDHIAQGRFSPHSAFMLARGQRQDIRLFRDVVQDNHQPTETTTGLAPWTVAGDDWDAQFAIGLHRPDLWYAWHEDPDVEGVTTRLWVATTDARSWAAIDCDGRQKDRFTAWQHGPRRLWDEIESTWAWYADHGRPGPERFGLTVTRDGQRVWLDTPDNVTT
ncbi:methyltransferase domain-containing protein [Streptomyces sp. NPDC020379]|uniref:methyltransferase domain-containing protein n=1 Tax=Streptomyces sp. NPDC020379 TaxID=3365071 RepID=UPI00379EF099